MNPSPAAIAAIKAFVAALAGGWAGNTDAQVVAAANNPTIANPTPQGTVARPFTLAQLLSAISAASQQNLNGVPGMGQLILDIRAGDVTSCLEWVAFLQATAKITSAEATVLQAIVQATQPDPSWSATIGWVQDHLGRPLDTNDSATARAS